jgi:hypothetical protein
MWPDFYNLRLEELPFNSVGVYRVRSVDSKSNVEIQKLKLHPPANFGEII